MENQKDKKIYAPGYINIPIEIFMNDNLSETAKFLYHFIESLDNDRGCFASNEFLSKIMGVSTTAISVAVSKLIEQSYIKRTGFDGRERTLKVDRIAVAKMHEKSMSDFRGALSEGLSNPKPCIEASLKHNSNSINKQKIDEFSLSKDKQCVAHKGATQVQRKLLRRPKKINREEISNSLRAQQEKLPLKESKPIPPKIQEILNYHSLLLHKYKPDSKAYTESAKVIGKLLRGNSFKGMNGRYAKYDGKKFSVDEIKWVLDRIKQAGHPDYYPKTKRSLKAPFNLLVYNPRTTNKEFESNFIHYFENEPKHYGNGVSLIDDPQPDITQTYRTFYTQNVIGGIKYEFNNVEENKLREGAKKNIEFLKENRSNMEISGIDNYVSFTRHVIKAIKTYYDDRGGMIEIGTFSSPRTWKKIVPDYLIKQGILRPPLQIE